MTEKLYNYYEVQKLARRIKCEKSDQGHGFTAIRTLNFAGQYVTSVITGSYEFHCGQCDAVLSVTYPELGSEVTASPHQDASDQGDGRATRS